MSYKEYKCPRCKRVHAAISLADAQAAGGDIAFYYRCYGCHTPTSKFVPAGPSDAPDGCTLTPVVVPGAWE